MTAGMIGQFLAFSISAIMIAIGVILSVISAYDRRKSNSEVVNKAAALLAREPEKMAASPIDLGDLSKLIDSIMKIQNPWMQVGVFLTVFGIVVMIIAVFIPF